MFLCIATTCLFSQCGEDKDNDKHHGGDNKEWVEDESFADSRTIIVYVVAENSIWNYATQEHVEDITDSCDITEIISGVRTARLKKNDKVVVYLDDDKAPRIFSVDRDVKGIKFADLVPEYKYDEDVNSASAEQFSKVIDYVKAKHPADSYGLVLWSHGSGWIPSTYEEDNVPKQNRSFGVDNGDNTLSNVGNQMSITDLAKVLEEKGGVDFVFFDACFMQTIELDYELRRAAKYVIGSPAEIPGPGADYRKVIPAMFKKDEYARQIVEAYYDGYKTNSRYGVIVSAVDENKLDGFASYMKTVVANNAPALFNAANSSTLNYYNHSKFKKSDIYYNKPDFYDIQGVMLNALDTDAYAQWREEFDKVVVKNLFTSWWFTLFPNPIANMKVIPEQCGGVSMFLPMVEKYNWEGYVEQSNELEWGKYVWNGITSKTGVEE